MSYLMSYFCKYIYHISKRHLISNRPSKKKPQIQRIEAHRTAYISLAV